MLLSRESIYPFSHASFRWSTCFARYRRSSFLFFLLSLPLPFVLTGGQRDILLLFCLFASISLRIPWGPRRRTELLRQGIQACEQQVAQTGERLERQQQAVK